MTWLWICLGGAAGTGARYASQLAAVRLLGGAFPWGTFAVNVLGSAVMGLVVQLSGGPTPLVPERIRLPIATGVLGGFTTYSSFNQELLSMLGRGATGQALAYLGGTVITCLAGGWLGMLLGKVVVG